MRTRLSKCDSKEIRVFTGYLSSVQYDRQMVKYVYMLDRSGNEVETYIGQHVLVAKSPFKNCAIGDKVRFTGKVKKYTRADGSQDYGIIVNKAKTIVE